MENLLPIVLVSVFFLVIQIAIVRYVFRIDTQIRNQNKMINLLAHLLKVNGVPEDDVDFLTYKKNKKQNKI